MDRGAVVAAVPAAVGVVAQGCLEAAVEEAPFAICSAGFTTASTVDSLPAAAGGAAVVPGEAAAAMSSVEGAAAVPGDLPVADRGALPVVHRVTPTCTRATAIGRRLPVWVPTTFKVGRITSTESNRRIPPRPEPDRGSRSERRRYPRPQAKRTRSTGPIRKYVARRLAYDQEYQIEVTAVVDRGGRQLVRSETISSRAGEERDVQISFDNTLPPPATSVTVHVPAEAKVYLAGNPTNQTGETRVFTTDALPAGATWGDYRVVAEIERDGQVVTLEKTLDVAAGGTYELSFDFSTAETRVAAR